jgi:surfactin synthase thioesterase subunit/glycosyltransferase involved in cell wall biosynthesis
MRILLAASASYEPPKGGSTRSNLLWLRALAAHGHHCLVLSEWLNAAESPAENAELLVDGVRIRRVANITRHAHVIAEAVADFCPDFVLVSSEDLSHVLLREAYRAAPDRLIYLAHTPQWFPFGPEAWHADAQATEFLRQALAIVAIGEHVAGYVEEHLGRSAAVLHPPTYGTAPWPEFGHFDRGFVLMVNPCTVKGLPIFLEVASRFPQIPFAALRGWGTTAADEASLRALPNVQVLSTVPDIDDVLRDTRVFLMPSLWYEGFGLIAMEAMLRGIPTLASDFGGLRESCNMPGALVPIEPITEWLAEMDETGMPVPKLRPQPIDAWEAALGRLLQEEEAYAKAQEAARRHAEAFVSRWSVDDFERFLQNLRPKGRRILLAHNSIYFPSLGGGDKSNRLLMEALARAGHQVEVFTRLERFDEASHQAFLAEVASRGVEPDEVNESEIRFERGGVRVRVLSRSPQMRAAFRSHLAEFSPDLILCSTDDPAQLLLDIALDDPKARVVYLVRATIAVPFGPDASSLSPARTERLRSADAVIGVSEYVARYCREHGGLESLHVPISLGDDPAPPNVGHHANPYVTLVNPTPVKGLAILLGLADAMPDVAFAAVASWGTSPEVLAELACRPNITLLPHADDITTILRQTRITLVPSLWAEARSRMVVESLSRGVPVLAADTGGLPEAMCGMDYLLPVNPIRTYKANVNEQMVPEAVVPAQDLTPWVETLRRLIEQPEHWADLSQRSRQAALAYLRGISVKPLEEIFESILARPSKSAPAAPAALPELSPSRRRLISLLLAERAAQRRNRYFPDAQVGTVAVYLFPWAGAGARAWRFLEPLEGFQWLPCLLPGREERHESAPMESMTELVAAICDELGPRLSVSQPFLFAGHSMGAALAFEVARELRRRELPLPEMLLASSCRAPHLRRGWTPPPDPDEGELRRQLQLLNAPQVLDEPALQALLPVFRADTALFRHYRYEEDARLELPITAMAGSQEPNLSAAEVQGWEKETNAGFRFVSAPGGHFWLREQPRLFQQAVLESLAGETLPTAT